ncbi:MAG: dephospho-CoA kinase [Bacteroidetes bacterium SW_11_45_7]|nr:MAG: dephospho-CoA kinase [Bacteroidetes bacterium SW_11_45_7]
MTRVGITGGIGSGKTTVCRIFEALRIPVYYADDRAKKLMQEDDQLIRQVKEAFGEEMYDAHNRLQRQKLADIVFNDEAELKTLNSLVHPAVFRDGQKWAEKHQDVPYTLKEAALMFESGSYQWVDKMIVVTAPEETRIQRITERDGSTPEQVRARMAQQMPQEEKDEKADFLIHNDGTQLLIPQVLEIDGQLR